MASDWRAELTTARGWNELGIDGITSLTIEHFAGLQGALGDSHRVAAGDFVTAADVALAENLQAVRVRREMEALAQDSAEVADTAVDLAVPDN